MSNATLQIVQYLTVSCDGWDHSEWCVYGELHVRHYPAFFIDEDERIDIIGPCDGKCRRETYDLRPFLSELQQQVTHPGYRNPIFLDFDSGSSYYRKNSKPIVGHLFVRGYCKRNSRWNEICDGYWHTSVCEDLQSLCGERITRHSVEKDRCDGSCKKSVTPSDRLQRILKRYMRMRNRTASLTG